MKLIRQYKALELATGEVITQRTLVSVGAIEYRRIAGLVDPLTGDIVTVLASPLWQERIHTGEFHNLFDPARIEALENDYLLLPFGD